LLILLQRCQRVYVFSPDVELFVYFELMNSKFLFVYLVCGSASPLGILLTKMAYGYYTCMQCQYHIISLERCIFAYLHRQRSSIPNSAFIVIKTNCSLCQQRKAWR
jgi:hypothetical protein